MKKSVKMTALVLAAMLVLAGCAKTESVDSASNETSVEASVETSTETSVSEEAPVEEAKTVSFKVIVVDGEGNESSFDYTTDKATVGEALLEEGLIEGSDSEYGLYVTKVNGIVADYNVDGTYWAFYINGEYAMTGVDSTNVEEGAVYSFKVEK